MLLTGCRGEESLLAQAIEFRGELISRSGCSFRAQITADYGQEVQSFTLDCDVDEEGTVSFYVVEPETIEGITGSMEGESGMVTYDGLQLVFPLMINDQISPMSAPALTVDCWMKEFILSAGLFEDLYRVSYEKKINSISPAYPLFYNYSPCAYGLRLCAYPKPGLYSGLWAS